jgi:hypothetical protein
MTIAICRPLQLLRGPQRTPSRLPAGAHGAGEAIMPDWIELGRLPSPTPVARGMRVAAVPVRSLAAFAHKTILEWNQWKIRPQMPPTSPIQTPVASERAAVQKNTQVGRPRPTRDSAVDRCGARGDCHACSRFPCDRNTEELLLVSSPVRSRRCSRSSFRAKRVHVRNL